MDHRAVGSPVWGDRREEIIDLVQRGRISAEGLAGLQDRLAEAAWQTDLSETRRSLATHGRSLFRWFRKDYRKSLAMLRGLLKSELPRTLAERLDLVDEIIAIQDGLKTLDHDPIVAQLGRDAFGNAWKGSKSD
jgi:hypothetical protein